MESPHPFAFYSLCYFSSLFSKRLEHPGYALFLLFHVRVNIEIKGYSNVGMTEQYTYCLVVTLLSMQRIAKLWRSPWYFSRGMSRRFISP